MAMKLPRVERLNQGAPIIERRPEHPWESKVTFNPACVLIQDSEQTKTFIDALPVKEAAKAHLRQHKSLCVILYRAQGPPMPDKDYTHSAIGLAVSTPDLRVLLRLDQPVLVPTEEYHDLGIEDPRVTAVGDRYVMLYAAYHASHPRNKIRIALATSENLLGWKHHGLLKASFNEIDNKNAMLFEQKIGGKFILLHRPMESEDRMMIHWAESDDLFATWKTRGALMRPLENPAFVDTWIGGGAPPVRLSDGKYLIIYHIGNRRADGSREYDLGIAVLDPTKPDPVIRRDEPLLRPETLAETKGDATLGVNNVVFICGAYFYQGDLYFPYAGADTCVLAGRIRKDELERYLASTA